MGISRKKKSWSCQSISLWKIYSWQGHEVLIFFFTTGTTFAFQHRSIINFLLLAYFIFRMHFYFNKVPSTITYFSDYNILYKQWENVTAGYIHTAFSPEGGYLLSREQFLQTTGSIATNWIINMPLSDWQEKCMRRIRNYVTN